MKPKQLLFALLVAISVTACAAPKEHGREPAASAVALDLASIETLTSGAPALGRAFDERAGLVQLVMLLSPT